MFGSDLEPRECKSETQFSQVRVRGNEECLPRENDYAKGHDTLGERECYWCVCGGWGSGCGCSCGRS